MKQVAIYIRMSTDEQTESPERQRAGITRYCEEKGYRIFQEYKDEGKRGWDDTRPGFQALLADAKVGKFDVIVVDEVSRLSRNETVDYIATVVHPLRQAGVTLDSVAEGVQDWDELYGIIMTAVRQDKSKQETVTLGRRTATGQAKKALEGKMFSGRAPFGYTYKLDSKGQRVGYDPGKPEDVAVVQRVFDFYVNEDLSLLGVVNRLNSLGILTPEGCTQWGKTTVHNMLTNRVYAGDYVWGKVMQGRYYRCPQGQVATATKSRTKSERLSPENWWVIPDTHQPIIERELFKQAQQKLQNNRQRTSPSRTRGEFPLSGLMVCSHCGSPMYGTKVRSGGINYASYRCGGYMSNAKCSARTAREKVLLEVFADIIRKTLLHPANLDRVREEFKRQSGSPASESERRERQLKKQAEKLEANISRARGNMLLMDPEDIPWAKSNIKQWERERTQILADLEQMRKQSPTFTFEEFVSRIGNLLEVMESGEPGLVRMALRETIASVELRFDEVKKKVYTRYPLAGGVIHLFEECADPSKSGRATGR
jgi:site-specific DNA recombinase